MKRTSPILLIIAYVAFISLGLPDGLLGVAWPSISASFGRALGELGILFIALMVGFLTASVNSGRLISRVGVGPLLAGSTVLVTAGLTGYVLAPAWWMIIGSTVLLGAGGGAIDSGINAYAAAHFSPRHVNWLHACYGIGATLGPLLMTAIIAGGWNWRWGYALIGVVLASLAIGFGLTRRQWRNGSGASEADQAEVVPVSASVVLRRPLVWLGMLLFLVYTGLEVTAGQWTYSLFTEGRGIDPGIAGTWISIYWGSLTVGRIVFGVLVERVRAAAILRINAVGVVIAALLVWLDIAPLLSFVSLAAIGFLLAPMFPLLIAQTPARLGGGSANHAIGFQVAAANVGVAVVPGGAGLLVRATDVAIIGPFVFMAALVFLLLLGMLQAVSAARPSPSPQQAAADEAMTG